jgi:2'-5' RNA ligase
LRGAKNEIRGKMFFCIAGLIDDASQNKLRKFVGSICQKYNTGVIASLLPQHVSLKIAFYSSGFEMIEKYFDELASRISPFEINGDNVQLIKIQEKDQESGLIWYAIEEENILRGLHNTLNHELMQKFHIPMAEYDGDNFHFHSTLIYGNKSFGDYATIFADVENMLPKMRMKIEKIGLFCCHENQIVAGKFYTYRIRNLVIAST